MIEKSICPIWTVCGVESNGESVASQVENAFDKYWVKPSVWGVRPRHNTSGGSGGAVGEFSLDELLTTIQCSWSSGHHIALPLCVWYMWLLRFFKEIQSIPLQKSTYKNTFEGHATCELDLFQSLIMFSQGTQLSRSWNECVEIPMSTLTWMCWWGHSIKSICHRWSQSWLVTLPPHATTSLWFYCRWLERAGAGPPLCFPWSGWIQPTTSTPPGESREKGELKHQPAFMSYSLGFPSFLWYRLTGLGQGFKGHTFCWSWRTF